MWSTRQKLIVSCLFTLFLIIYLKFTRKNVQIEPKTSKLDLFESEWLDEKSFLELTKKAKEEIDYLHASIIGKAEIDTIVEKTQKLQQFYGCKKNKKIQTKEKLNEWKNNENWWIFSAFFDQRKNNSLFPEKNSIQIIASTFSKPPSNVLYCHVYYPDESNFVTKAVLRHIWQRGWDPRFSFYNSFLITCGLPDDQKPSSVALSYFKCPRNMPEATPVQIHEEQKSEKSNIGVCLKGLDFLDDKSQDLIEWIEFQFLMGADKIRIYVYSIPEKSFNVLKFYEKTKNVEVIFIELPGYQPNIPFVRHNFIWRNKQQKRRQELIPYNDCFNRFSQTHDFVLIVDFDEFVVPLKHSNWQDLLQFVQKNSTTLSSFAIPNVYKFKSFGQTDSEVKILKQNHRSSFVDPKGLNEKSFINTKTVATVFNHFALHRLHNSVSRTLHVDSELALKLHYKSTCPNELGLDCAKISSNPILDTSLDRFSEQLLEKIKKAKSDLENFEKSQQ